MPVTEDQVRRSLRGVKDPELNLNIVDLGLVYDISVGEAGAVEVKMTLTSPGCPAGPEIMTDAEQAVRAVEGVTDATIELIWEPYWTPERIDPRGAGVPWPLGRALRRTEPPTLTAPAMTLLDAVSVKGPVAG